MSDLKLNDPVYVHRDGGSKLEGIVAFFGEVGFAEGDDWVGVRLTGTSAGNGKNDGSVQSQTYFKCPPNCGLFVRAASLEKRQLSKLEVLRLRRELASSGISSVSAPSITGSAAATTPPRSAAKSTSATTPAAARLEELRRKREAIIAERETSTGQEANQQALESLKKQLEEKDDSLASLQEKLAKVENELSEIKELNETMTSEKNRLQDQLKSRLPVPTSKNESDSVVQPVPDTWSREKQILESQVIQSEEQIRALTKQLEKQKSEHSTEVTQLRSESLAYKNELQKLSEQSEQRGTADASHYKEKAKLQAQIAALKREVTDLRNEKIELDSTLEDLALDKDHLQEENESLAEKYEEVKIDCETAQMEVDELRMELEEAKAAAEKASSSMEMSVAAAAAGTTVATNAESDDMAQALSIQNARLREALIRLREQSSVEKMELTRQLKAVEKEAEAAKNQVKENTDLEDLKQKLEGEIRDLKDMVDQGAAFEGMVEDLSDKLLEMEEQNVSLTATIRELEESAELTTEMEEVQAEEIKAMTRDLEDRETVIRNLEEAIKMQRKREDDFNRTVTNYRSTVETLKKEKEALMETQQGGEGEKSSLLASSQKALSRAAQLVSDAAEMRKREAQAALEKIQGQAQSHLAERLEKMLPKGIVTLEVSAVKGELLVSRIAGLVSGSLDGIASSFDKAVRVVPLEDEITVDPSDESISLVLSDESQQDVANMIHQSECAQVLIGTGVDAIKYLSAGQWPDLLTDQQSADLGSHLGHNMIDLEAVLISMLKSLKEEGGIDTHQSSIDSLRQANSSAKITLESELQSGDMALLSDWNPPGLELLDRATRAKFACLGAASTVAVSCRGNSLVGAVGSQLRSFFMKLDALSVEASQACSRLTLLDVQQTDEVSSLTSAADLLQNACDALITEVRKAMLEGEVVTLDELKACDDVAEAAIKVMAQFSSALRSAKLNTEENGIHHPLSPEAVDAWIGLSRLTMQLRGVDGDDDDINFLVRARNIEHRLAEAINNEPKLQMANSKVASLEKVRAELCLDFLKILHIISSLTLSSCRVHCRVLPLDPRKLPCRTHVSPSWKNCLQNQAPNLLLPR